MNSPINSNSSPEGQERISTENRDARALANSVRVNVTVSEVLNASPQKTADLLLNPKEKISEQAQFFLDSYKKKAESLHLKDVQGDWLLADGLEALYLISGKTEKLKSNTDPDIFPYRLENLGTYLGNSGILSFIDKNGQQFVGNSSKENRALLETAGYREAKFFSFNVPFSSGDVIADEKLRSVFRAMRGH